MIIWKNKVFELFVVFSVFWTFVSLPHFIMYCIFGWSAF